MKKWLSFTLVFLMLFTWIPVIQAKAQPVQTAKEQSGKPKPDKPVKAKKAKASGTVTAVDEAAGKLTLDAKGQPLELVVDQKTKLKLPGWKNPTLADVWEGDSVKVEYMAAEEMQKAISIHVSKKKGSVNGKVESIDLEAQTFTAAGKTVQVTEKTAWKWKGEKGTLADLLQGDQVSVSGYLKGEVLQASSIKVKRSGTVVKGTVASVDLEARTILLDDVKVVVADDAKLRLNGEEATLEEVLPGDKVVATGQKTGDVITAKVVSIQREPVKWEGSIEVVDVTAGTITLNGQVITVTDDTRIKQDDQALTLADLVVGTQVEVKAMQQGETWLALKIKVKEEDDEEDDDEKKEGEVEGRVEAIDAFAMTLTIHGKTIQVTEATKIKAEKQENFSFAEIQVGDKVEAEGTWEEGVLIAQELKVENEDD
ncbi:DUF5666 domain-containing protein [Brevibacillus sp. H7]|uniref:DUF5666 domain-containing protein n=1 Tax=Brevibacillus sp. H7 TaxID=3349138 RepID=UPI0038210BB3